jgi:hypothetical protein
LEDGTYSPVTGVTQNFLNFYDSGLYSNDNTTLGQTPIYPYTGNTEFTYLGIGGSRIDELKKYGSTGYTQTLTSGSSSDGVGFTGYTLSHVGSTVTGTLQYRDYADGYTMVTGNTTGFTKEEVFDAILTRNEHFLGFVEQPTVYSDVFVERGKQGVMEVNLRLGEVDNMGELGVYGGGFFKVKKQ